MKTLYCTLIITIFSLSSLWAQWEINGNDINNTNSGYVGIGTLLPQRKTHVLQENTSAQVRLERTGNYPGITDFGTDANGLHFWVGGYDYFGGEELFINSQGSIGFGTDQPQRKIHVIHEDASAQVRLERTGNSSGITDFGTDSNGLHFWVGGYDYFGGEEFIIRSSGNVGIGTANPDAKLAVNGDIHTREVRVDLNGAVAPDYVFEPDYNLRTLAETEKYIKQNKHLPEIPSATDMEENGIELKAMNLKLLQKVEELMLYTIEQQKLIEIQTEQLNEQKRSFEIQLSKQQQFIEAQQKQLQSLQKQISELEQTKN